LEEEREREEKEREGGERRVHHWLQPPQSKFSGYDPGYSDFDILALVWYYSRYFKFTAIKSVKITLRPTAYLDL